MPFGATWMDLEGIMLSEISQREKQTHRHSEQTGGYQRRVGGGDK